MPAIRRTAARSRGRRRSRARRRRRWDVEHDDVAGVVGEHGVEVAAVYGPGPALDQGADLLFVGRHASFPGSNDGSAWEPGPSYRSGPGERHRAVTAPLPHPFGAPQPASPTVVAMDFTRRPLGSPGIARGARARPADRHGHCPRAARRQRRLGAAVLLNRSRQRGDERRRRPRRSDRVGRRPARSSYTPSGATAGGRCSCATDGCCGCRRGASIGQTPGLTSTARRSSSSAAWCPGPQRRIDPGGDVQMPHHLHRAHGGRLRDLERSADRRRVGARDNWSV